MIHCFLLLPEETVEEIVYTNKAEVGMLRWLWGAVAQWSEHLQLKQEALGLILGSYPGLFLFQLACTNADR